MLQRDPVFAEIDDDETDPLDKPMQRMAPVDFVDRQLVVLPGEDYLPSRIRFGHGAMVAPRYSGRTLPAGYDTTRSGRRS